MNRGYSMIAVCSLMIATAILAIQLSIDIPTNDRFRRRFDAIKIGMSQHEVRVLLGAPQPHDFLLNITWAEVWYSFDGRLVHTVFDHRWKNYWLYLDADDYWVSGLYSDN